MDYSKIENKVLEIGEKIGWTNKEVFKELAKIIPDNEKLYFCVSGVIKKGGVTAIGVTSANIYMTEKPSGFSPIAATIIPLGKITSVSSKGGMLGGSIQIAEGTIVHELSSILPAIATKAVTAIHQAQSEAVQPLSNAAPISQADELAKFKRLLDDGVLTQEEFDKKKSQILGL